MSKKKTTEAKDIHVSGDFIAGDQYNYYYTGDFASLAEFYISPEPVFQRVRVDEFIGRDWLTAKVDAFLNDPNRKSGAFLLIGDAGVGKTSFVAHLVKERRYLHLFAEQAPGQAMLQRAMQSLGSQLVTRYQIDPYKDRDTLNALSVFPDFLERILRLAASTLTEGEKIVIVCDALDEAGTFPDHFVFGLPKELPDGVYFILSQRPVNVKLPNFEPVIENLEAQGEGNLQDIEAYLSAVAKRPEVAGQIRSKEYSEEFFIQTLKEKSQGVWMYLHYIIKEIESGARAPLDLANLPTGLVGYYAEYWDAWRTGKRGKGEEAWDELYAPLLTTLAAAQEAITVEKLIQWANVTAKPRDVTRLLTEHWRAFITEKDINGQKAYTPYHLSLKDFITGRVDTDKLSPAQANLVKDLATQTMDAHKRIVSAFEKECNSEWEKLVEQDYSRLHLTAHLNGAGEYEKLRIMLTEGDEKIKWVEAREKKEETYAGYLNDLTYVWDYVEREQNYALAIRCMLIENSIHSLATNISSELLAELGKTGLWSYARCLSTIRQKSDSTHQATSLKSLVPIIPKPLFGEVLTLAGDIKDESARADALKAFAPYLTDEFKLQAFSITLGIKDEFARTSVLSELTPHLTDELKTQALAAVCKTKNSYHLAYSLRDIAPYLSDESMIHALMAARAIKDEYFRASALSGLAPYLKDEIKIQVLQDALSTASKIKSAFYRTQILSDLAPLLGNELKFNLLKEILFSVSDFKDSYNRAHILGKIAPHLCDELKPQALAVAHEIDKNYYRANALSVLAPYLSDELKLQELDFVREIDENYSRSRALLALAPHMSYKLKIQVFQEALSVALDTKDENERASMLSEIAPHVGNNLKFKILTAVCGLNSEYIRARALSNLAPHLSDELKPLTFVAVCEIKDERSRTSVLSSLVPYLSDELKPQAFAEICAIKDEHSRASALSALVPHLSDEFKPLALTAANKIKSGSDRSRVLGDLALNLKAELKSQVLQEALVAAREIEDEYGRAETFSVLVPYLTNELKQQVLHEILVTLRKFNFEFYGHPVILRAIVSYLSDNLKHRVLQEALTIAQDVEDISERAYILSDLIPHLPNDLMEQTLANVLDFKEEYAPVRIKTLSILFPQLRDALKPQVLRDALDSLNKIKYDSPRARSLSILAPLLADEQKLQILDIACNIKKESSRVRALSALAPYLTDELKLYALDAAREIKDAYYRVKALSVLMSYLTNELKKPVLQEALLTAHEIKTKSDKANALLALVPHLGDELKPQILLDILDVTREIKSNYDRSHIFLALMSYLGDDLKSQVLSEAQVSARKIKKEFDRPRILINLALLLNANLKPQALQEALSASRAIKNKSSRAHSLLSIAPYIPEEKISILVEVFCLLDELHSSEYFGLVANTLSIGKDTKFIGLEKCVYSFIKSNSQKSRPVGVLAAGKLMPALVNYSGEQIADELYRAIQDTARWWP